MEWRLPAGGWAPQPHVHPAITEEYEVLEGEFDVRIGRTWRRLRQGESAAVAPGIVHTSRVAAGPVAVRNVHRPANDFEPYIGRDIQPRRPRDHGLGATCS